MAKTIFRDFNVRIGIDQETGNKVSELWLQNRHKHRLDGPAEQEWDARTGVCTLIGYYANHRPSRDEAAAVSGFHPQTGELVFEAWAIAGAYHREDDQPAIWEKDIDTGVIVSEEYWDCGMRHRDNGLPAVINRDAATGIVVRQEYHVNGDLVRVETPIRHRKLEP